MVYPIDERAAYVKSFYKTLFQRTPVDVAMSNWLTLNPTCIIYDIRLITISVTVNRDSSMNIEICPNVTIGIDYGECAKSEGAHRDLGKAMAESRQNLAKATRSFMNEGLNSSSYY